MIKGTLSKDSCGVRTINVGREATSLLSLQDAPPSSLGLLGVNSTDKVVEIIIRRNKNDYVAKVHALGVPVGFPRRAEKASLKSSLKSSSRLCEFVAQAATVLRGSLQVGGAECACRKTDGEGTQTDRQSGASRVVVGGRVCMVRVTADSG